jgi:hypothetical protein
VDVLRGLHHPRVAYPGEPKDETPAAAAPAPEPAPQTNGADEREEEEGERINKPANGQSAF